MVLPQTQSIDQRIQLREVITVVGVRHDDVATPSGFHAAEQRAAISLARYAVNLLDGSRHARAGPAHGLTPVGPSGDTNSGRPSPCSRCPAPARYRASCAPVRIARGKDESRDTEDKDERRGGTALLHFIWMFIVG